MVQNGVQAIGLALFDRTHFFRRRLARLASGVAIWGLAAQPAFAQDGSTPQQPIAWGLILFCVLLGLIITLLPSKRKTDFKRPKED